MVCTYMIHVGLMPLIINCSLFKTRHMKFDKDIVPIRRYAVHLPRVWWQFNKYLTLGQRALYVMYVVMYGTLWPGISMRLPAC